MLTRRVIHNLKIYIKKQNGGFYPIQINFHNKHKLFLKHTIRDKTPPQSPTYSISQRKV